jgi:arginyl-tRNA synthetase
MKHKIIEEINNCLKSIYKGIDDIEISIEKPKNKDHGDIATNIALLLAKKIKKNPLEISNELKKELIKSNLFESIEIAKPGFINFKLAISSLTDSLNKIIDSNNNYGKNKSGQNKKVLVEFVSANPTGPLTVGHGRGAIIGDVISNILTWNGFQVDREYYYNNAGRQMRILGESLKARYYELLNKDYVFPDDGYKGDYIKDIATSLINDKKDTLLNESDDFFKTSAEEYIFNKIKKTLSEIGLKFNNYFNEKTLYDDNKIFDVVDKLKDKNLIYEKEGATWFKATDIGMKSDKVLIKSTGEPTYRLPDIAYHATKFERGYDLCVDVFGADHMDAYPDVLAAIEQLGFNKNNVKVIIHQFISILKDNEIVKMSTRKGNFITLEKLIDDVGVDVVRYFFIMRSINSHLNFDLKLAKEKSEKNPIFYIQYAHARICTILDQNDNIKNPNLSLLNHEKEIKLIYLLIEFEDLILKLSKNLEPQLLANYLFDLATKFHKYYSTCRIINDNDDELTKSRLYLIKAIKITLSNGLSILGISNPERM